MKSTFAWLAFVLALLAPGLASAANWVALGRTSETAAFLDLDSVRIDGQLVIAAGRIAQRRPIDDPKFHKLYYSENDVLAFNCAERLVGTITRTAYGKDGEVAFSGSNSPSNLHFHTTAPSSFEEALLDRACAVGRQQMGLKPQVLTGSIFSGEWRPLRSAASGDGASYRADTLRVLPGASSPSSFGRTFAKAWRSARINRRSITPSLWRRSIAGT